MMIFRNLALAASVALTAGQPVSPPPGILADPAADAGLKFEAWKEHAGRQYASAWHEKRARETFAANDALIHKHNARGLTYTLAHNGFSDLTHEEFKAAMGLRKGAMPVVPASETFVAPAPRDVPDEFDARPLGVVNAIKNQGMCGSCWSFSAVAAMEGAFNLKHNGSMPSQCDSSCNGNPCCSFSEQELVDCVNGGACDCNKGGIMSDGMVEIATHQKGFINTESQYPYTSGEGKNTKQCKPKANPVNAGIIGYANVTQGDETALKAAVFQKSIISIGIDASQGDFQFYSSGVYNNPSCKNDLPHLDHGVSLVGYGVSTAPTPGPNPPGPGPADCPDNNDEKSCLAEAGCRWCVDSSGGPGFCFSFDCNTGEQEANPFNLASTGSRASNSTGTDYWVMRNSWGEEWGMQGYMWMSRNADNQCGVATQATYPLLK